jgi:hypothetical protein
MADDDSARAAMQIVGVGETVSKLPAHHANIERIAAATMQTSDEARQ